MVLKDGGLFRHLPAKTVGVYLEAGSRYSVIAKPFVSQSTVDHDSDLVLQAAATREHGSDLVLSLSGSLSHESDLLLVQRIETVHGSDLALTSSITKEHASDLALAGGFSVFHGSDLVLVKQQTVSQDSDSVLRGTSTRLHDSDFVLLAAETVEHGSDLVVAERELLQHASDLILRGSPTVSHGTHAALQQRYTKYHNIEAALRRQPTVAHNVDAVLRRISNVGHSFNALLVNRQSASHNFNTAPQKSGWVTYGLDAPLYKQFAETHALEAVARATKMVGHSADVVLQDTASAVHSIDTFLINRREGAHDLDISLQATGTAVHDADAVLQKMGAADHSADVLLVARLESGYGLDTVLLRTKQAIHSINVPLLATEQAAHGLNVLIVNRRSVAYGVDALPVNRRQASHAFGASLQVTKRATYSVDTPLQKTQHVAHGVDASLRMVFTKAHGFSAAARATRVTTHKVDAVLRRTSKIAHRLDVALRVRNQASHGLDAALVKAQQVTHTLDILSVRRRQVTHGAGAALQATLTAGHGLDTFLVNRRSLVLEVGPAGGLFECLLTGVKVVLDVPAGAFGSDTLFTVIEDASTYPTPSGEYEIYRPVGDGLRIDFGAEPSADITVYVTYPHVDGTDLRVMRLGGNAWERLTTPELIDNTVKFDIAGSGTFGVFANDFCLVDSAIASFDKWPRWTGIRRNAASSGRRLINLMMLESERVRTKAGQDMACLALMSCPLNVIDVIYRADLPSIVQPGFVLEFTDPTLETRLIEVASTDELAECTSLDSVYVDYVDRVAYFSMEHAIVSVTGSHETDDGIIMLPPTSLIPDMHHVWNMFDEFGLELGTPRLAGERNYDYRNRLLAAGSYPSDSTRTGLVYGIARLLGLIKVVRWDDDSLSYAINERVLPGSVRVDWRPVNGVDYGEQSTVIPAQTIDTGFGMMQGKTRTVSYIPDIIFLHTMGDTRDTRLASLLYNLDGTPTGYHRQLAEAINRSAPIMWDLFRYDDAFWDVLDASMTGTACVPNLYDAAVEPWRAWSAGQ